jgi:peptidoglycan L-alanyl-D-glutamate endopeptidase CwlK
MELNKRSLKSLEGVHPLLVNLIEVAASNTPIDFTVVEGIRSKERQMELFQKGVSKSDGVKYPSNHQVKTDGYGHAVDIYANPINVNDTVRIRVVADHIKSVAKTIGVSIYWGGDWKNFKDYPHFELR